MSQARISSLDALKEYRAALATFGTYSQQALCAVDLEIRRMMDWLTGEQYAHWKAEIQRREEAVAEAKVALSRARMSTMTVSGNPAPCTDQEVALRKAKLRLVEAEEKFKAVKHWARVIEEELLEYKGPEQQLATMLEGHVPVACAELDRYIESIEGYLSVQAPSSEAPPPATGGSSSDTTKQGPKAPTSAPLSQAQDDRDDDEAAATASRTRAREDD